MWSMPGDLAHVLAVRHHVGERGPSAGGGRATQAPLEGRRTVRRPPRGCPPAAAAATSSRWASAQAAFTNFGTKVTMHTPPPRAIASSTSSGALRGLSVTARAELWLKITGASATVERVAHRVGRDVGEVDHHPDAVHLPHDLAAERRQPARDRAVGGRVGPGGVRVVGQRQVAHPERVQLAERAERAVDRVPALRAGERGDPVRRPRPPRPRRRWSPTPAGRRTAR